MGNNNSIPNQIAKNEEVLSKKNDNKNERKSKDEIHAEYDFHERNNILSLPVFGEPIRIINHPTFIDTNQRREQRKEELNSKLENLIPVDSQTIEQISQGNNVIIDEYDFNTLISLISYFTQNSNILIICEKMHIGKIYENFNDTVTDVGILSENISNPKKSNIIDIQNCQNIQYDQYNIIIFIISSRIPLDLIQKTMNFIIKQKKSLIVYRMYPSFDYSNQIIINEFKEEPKHLIAQNKKKSILFLITNKLILKIVLIEHFHQLKKLPELLNILLF